MKFYKVYIFILIIIACFYFAEARASQKAVFPDSRSLQPAPANIKPNLSGNVNSREDGKTLSAQGKENISDPVTSHNLPNASNTEARQKNFVWLIIFLLAGFVAFLYLKPKKML